MLGQANSMRGLEYILSRYLEEIDCEDEWLQYEAAIAIAEQMIQQGDKMLRERVAERTQGEGL